MQLLPQKNTVRIMAFLGPLTVLAVWAINSFQAKTLLDIPQGVYIFMGVLAANKGWEKKVETTLQKE